MSTNPQILEIKSWDEVKKMLLGNDVPKAIKDALEVVCKGLNEYKKDYFYYGEIEFGRQLIEKGKIAIKNPILDYGFYDAQNVRFEDDILYADDPLGIVLDGKLEIFFENKSKYAKGNTELKYKVPIATLLTGSFFGTYGTIDKQYKLSHKDNARDWFVVSGDGNTIWVATSLHNQDDADLLDTLGDKFLKNKNSICIEKWSFFLNRYVTTKAKTKVIYLPKHIVDELFNLNNNPVLKIGWEQSLSLRNTFLKDNAVVNNIINHNGKYNHQQFFLIELYEYLLDVLDGKAECLIPIKEDKHNINAAFNEFNKNHDKNRTKQIQHVPFEFGNLQNNDFGIILLPMLPLKNEYTVNGLAELVKDIYDISQKQDTKNKIIDQIFGCSIKVQTSSKRIQKHLMTHQQFKDEYLMNIKHDYKNANFTSAEFSSFIVIKKR